MLFTKQAFRLLFHLAELLPFFAALCTVFVVRGDMANGVVSGKYCWFYCAMGAVAAVGTLCGFWSKRALRLRWVDALVAAFCLWSMAVTWANGGAGSAKFVLLALYFYLRSYLSLARSRARGGYLLLAFFVLTGAAEAAWGLGQLYGFCPSQHGRFKPTGSFFNPGPYAGYLAMVAPAALCYLLQDYRAFKRPRSRRYQPFYARWALAALAALGILLSLPASMSRAAWVAAAGGCGLAWLLHKKLRAKNYGLRAEDGERKKHKAIRATLLLGAAVAVAACGVGAYYLKKDSADGRLLIWKISAQAALKHPLGVGVGLGHFAAAYGAEQAAYFASGRGSAQEQAVAGSPEYGFSEYLQMGVELGAAPLLLFAGAAALTLRRGIRRKRLHAPACALCSLLLFAGMSYPFSVLPFAVCMVFFAALCASEEDGRQPVQKIFVKKNLHRCLLILLLIATFACLNSRRTTGQAYRSWQEAQLLRNAGLHEAAAEEYAKLYGELRYEVRFLFEYAQSLNKIGAHEACRRAARQAMKISCDPMLYNVAGRSAQAMKDYAAAERHFWQAAHVTPSRLYPYYLLAKLYAEMGLRDKAREMAKIVLTKEPKVDSQAVREMREELIELRAMSYAN